jgi:ABC-type sulfate transport system substrate-binding protein
MRQSFLSRARSAAVLVAVAALTASCSQPGSQATAPADDSAVHIVAFNASEPGWRATVPAFVSTPGHSAVRLAPSFGASGDQLQAVLAGKPADIAHFGDEPDITTLEKAGLVSPGWDAGPGAGIPFRSVATWVVRKGNPRNIANWSDLLRPGVEVITPSPIQVGSGRWGLLAGYAANSDGNQNPAAGQDYLRRLILEHVVMGPSTVQAAIDQFIQGRGDVLLVSESNALNLERQGQPVEHIVPPQTIRMDFPVAVLSKSRHKDEAAAVVDFLFSDTGQRLWAQQGFRPSNPGIAAEFAGQFPMPQQLWTITDLGGWDHVGASFFDPTNGFVTGLFNQATQ